jgi:Na+-transporting methylmalonyl-CoA/oxaloacetate decarboxylase gamma subunit
MSYTFILFFFSFLFSLAYATDSIKLISNSFQTQHAIRPPKEHAVDFVTKNMREVAQAAAAARRVKEPEAGGDKYKENLGKIPS